MAAPCDNLWIGDLPLGSTDDTVKSIFMAYGSVVSVKVLASKPGSDKVAALVRFASLEEATWVQENLNGNLAEGLDTPVIVQFAKNAGASGGKGAAGKGWSAQPAADWNGGGKGGADTGKNGWGAKGGWGAAAAPASRYEPYSNGGGKGYSKG